MDLYQHDSPTVYRFVLRGGLTGASVQNLEQAWKTAMSITNKKETVVDISGVTDADASGVELLFRMREAGVRLNGALPLKSELLLRSMGIPVAASGTRRGGWAVRLTHFDKLSAVMGAWTGRRERGRK